MVVNDGNKRISQKPCINQIIKAEWAHTQKKKINKCKIDGSSSYYHISYINLQKEGKKKRKKKKKAPMGNLLGSNW